MDRARSLLKGSRGRDVERQEHPSHPVFREALAPRCRSATVESKLIRRQGAAPGLDV
jgi:hypothetical protein